MHLKSLKLSDFAGIPAADLGPFGPGLTVIVGDNEAGKSTLLTALRAAFFQKHRASGEAVKALSPYLASGRPTVSLDFDIDGTAYCLHKAFLQRPMAELTWPAGSLSGDAVEEKLAELFRFTHPGAGEPKLEKHQGAFGLLWVEQGRSTGGLDLGAGKDAVTASLEGEVGQILGGERGRHLIAAAKALQDRFFTNSLRAVSTSPVTLAERQMAALVEALAVRRASRAAFEAKLDRLADRRASLRSLASDDAVVKAGAALDAAERAVARAAGLEGEVMEAAREVEHAKVRRDAALERLGQRDRAIAAVETSCLAAERARERLDDLILAGEAAGARLQTLKAARETAAARQVAAELADDAARLAADRQRLDREIAVLAARLDKARAVVDRLAVLRAGGTAAAIDAAAIGALEAADARCRDAAARLSVAAPSVVFEPDAGQNVTDADGETIEPRGRRTVLRRSVFTLEGFGALTIDPGGDAEALSRDKLAADRALDALLRKAGVASLAEARTVKAAAEARKAELAGLEKERAALLPEGFDMATAECQRLRQERDRIDKTVPARAGEAAASRAGAAASPGLSSSPPASAIGIPASDPESDTGAPDTAVTQKALRDAREGVKEAESTLDRARREDAARIAGRATAEADLVHGLAEVQRLRQVLAEAEAGRSRPALAEDAAAGEMDRAAKALVLEAKRRERDAADPETAARTLAARRRALDHLTADIGKLKEESLTLEGELRAEGATALGEDISRLEGEIAALEPRLKRLKLEADASKLLHATLIEARRAAREHWLGPIKTEVAPYLRLIHPNAEIALDDTTLEIRGLHRGGVEESFLRLSSGAREQVAVVTRIALAQVLKKGGHPAAVILDDALVNTDEKRLERMHLVLQKAAEDLQIIVLTCRERDFRGLGAPIVRL